jgi:Galactose oxidase, central domain
VWSRRLFALIAAWMVAGCGAPNATPGPPSSEPTAAASSLAPPPTTASDAPPPTESAVAAAPAWLALAATGPPAREDHTWTVDDAGERAYLFGGRDGDVVFGDMWAFDLATDTWTALPPGPGPDPRFGHEAVWVDNVGLVVFAGQAGPTTFFNDLWAFNPEEGSWRELPSSGAVPVSRYGTCAGIGPDGRLWISHGFTSENARFADTVAYDFTSGVWTAETPEPPLPVSRCLHGCWWTATGELALYGGQTTGTAALGDLWLLREGAWAAVEGARPAARNLYARARIDGGRQTLVFGGQAVDRTYLADAFVFVDGSTDAVPVEAAGPAPAARAGAEMVVDARGGRVLLFGGRDADRAYDDLWELSGIAVEG